MIKLPDNWQDTLRISPEQRALFLHFQNDARQYYTYYHRLDPAYSLEEILGQIGDRDFANDKAYVLKENLETVREEPADQHWLPAPLPGNTMYSLAQYKDIVETKKNA